MSAQAWVKPLAGVKRGADTAPAETALELRGRTNSRGSGMLYVIVGLPGRFTSWCDAVAARLAGDGHGPAAIIVANTIDELAINAIRAGVSHGVVACRLPAGRLRSALHDAGRNFVVAVDDPRIALSDLVVDEQMELAAATQLVASSCAALASYVRVSGALTLCGAGDDPIATARALAAHLGIAIGEAELARIVDDLAAAGVIPRAPDSVAAWHAFDAEQHGLVEDALACYVNFFEGGKLSQIIWRRDLFFLDDSLGERATRIIDITGRARCLAHGPDIMLAPGAWVMQAKLLFSRDACEHEFLVELSAGHELGSCIVRPEREGGGEVNFPFTIDEAGNQPIRLRLSNQRAAFDGAAAVDVIFLHPQG